MENTQTPEYAIETKNLFIFYGSFAAVSEVNMQIEKQRITAIIGPQVVESLHYYALSTV